MVSNGRLWCRGQVLVQVQPTPTKMTKKAKDKNEAWKIQETYEDQPHGWIQWKGTDVCMDIHCKCGCLVHIDTDFAYFVKCLECNTIYFCNGHIELIEIEEEPDHCVAKAYDSDKIGIVDLDKEKCIICDNDWKDCTC